VEEVKIVHCNSLEGLVDLVGIEPTTSSMPWNHIGSRRLILRQLTTEHWSKTGMSGDISGQFPARNFNM